MQRPRLGLRLAGISSMATQHVLAELVPAYREHCGGELAIETVGGVDAARRVREGEAFDLVVLAAAAIGALESAGRVVAGSRVDLARSRVAVAVAAGSMHPDIRDERALRDTLLDARAIGYSTGPSGACLERLLERWGIAARVRPQLRLAPPGVPVGKLVARGEAEIGLQQLSELIHFAGIDVVGVLPAEIPADTVFSGAVCTASREPHAAGECLAFLAAPAHDGMKRRHGMCPAGS